MEELSIQKQPAGGPPPRSRRRRSSPAAMTGFAPHATVNPLKRYNATELAEETGDSYGAILDARIAGFRMPGNRATAPEYFAWISANPHFREAAREKRALSPRKGRQ